MYHWLYCCLLLISSRVPHYEHESEKILRTHTSFVGLGTLSGKVDLLRTQKQMHVFVSLANTSC